MRKILGAIFFPSPNQNLKTVWQEPIVLVILALLRSHAVLLGKMLQLSFYFPQLSIDIIIWVYTSHRDAVSFN